MQIFRAECIYIPRDDAFHDGEDVLSFQWSDPMYGREGLTINLWEFHCHRNMPIRSGNGPPESMELHRDRIKIRFDPELARKLELDEEIEITFELSEDDYSRLQKTVDWFYGDEDDIDSN